MLAVERPVDVVHLRRVVAVGAHDALGQPVAGEDRVVAEVAVVGVQAGAALEPVSARAAEEVVRAGVAHEDVGARAAGDVLDADEVVVLARRGVAIVRDPVEAEPEVGAAVAEVRAVEAVAADQLVAPPVAPMTPPRPPSIPSLPGPPSSRSLAAPP